MLKAYNDLLKAKSWAVNQQQYEIALLLDELQHEISKNSNSGFMPGISRLRRYFNLQSPLSAAGVYICGDVGRGKTMMMDLFFQSIHGVHKRRYHFHDFMQRFHTAMHNVNKSKDVSEPIVEALDSIVDNIAVLCLDELQVNNIADAMVMGRVFTSLIQRGVFVFMTSNRHPAELFKDGLQRERFLPFIDLVMEKMKVVVMGGEQDYRALKEFSLNKVYHYPLDHAGKQFLSTTQQMLIGWHEWQERSIKVSKNRELLLLQTYKYVAKFSFAELCVRPMGAADYMEICHNFSTVIIEGIPQMGADSHNEALRFITLIDCLYNSKTKLICTAEVPYDQLYTGKTNRFEFDRTISRLREMQTAEYLHYEKDDSAYA
ncbi:MAG: AFG1 family ATPase [Proteobacteria bacterium]|nr:AFG1 family ATPase [Pseudomonadota bacterium]